MVCFHPIPLKSPIIAGIFEFAGAVLVGSHVTNTVRKKIVDIDLFTDNPGALMYGMLCADLSSALWLTCATYLKLPVSTTHSIIGAIIGFSLAFGGSGGVNWNKVWLIVASWVSSPIISGLISSLLFYLINTYIFKRENPFNNTQKMLIIIKINPNDTSAIGAEYKCTYKNTQSSFIIFFILPFYKHRNITATT